ncbi:MAG TPA: VRR-NUC domain-containing protein [Gemmatimonadaceae bacterium]|nr:VRR-NUC domain-containing protein [Gemmatimonadaceae bacterium]
MVSPESHPPEWTQLLRPTIRPIMQPIVIGSSAIAWYLELRFDRWTPPTGQLPPSSSETYRKTLVIGENGKWSVAEIELVKRMRAGGWSAGWVDTFGSAPRAWSGWIVDPGELPTALRRSYNAITNDTGRTGEGGQPDVIAWRGDTLRDCVLVEYKGPNDRVRPGQDDWLRAALRAGLSPNQFVVARWPKPRKERL